MIIKVRSTGGSAAAEFSSDATTWGGLLNEVGERVSLSGKKVLATTAEGDSVDYSTDINNTSAALPNTTTLTIMLVTEKVKSGV